MSRSADIDGSATLMIEMSRTTRNCDRQHTTRIHLRRASLLTYGTLETRGSRPSVASHDPARISSSPTIAPGPGRSPSSAIPSATAITGLTYVTTEARLGPIALINWANAKNAAAVHTTPRTTTDQIAPAVASPPGVLSA